MWWETIASIAYFLGNTCVKRYENLTMLSRVTAKIVGDVFLRHSVDCHVFAAHTVASLHDLTVARRRLYIS